MVYYHQKLVHLDTTLNRCLGWDKRVWGGAIHNCFILQVRAKLELGLNHDRPFEPTLSAGQSKAVLSALTEGWVLSKLIHGVFTVMINAFWFCFLQRAEYQGSDAADKEFVLHGANLTLTFPCDLCTA